MMQIVLALLVTIASVTNLGALVLNLYLLRYLVIRAEGGSSMGYKLPFDPPPWLIRWAKNRRYRPIKHEKIEGPVVTIGLGADPTKAVIVGKVASRGPMNRTSSVVPVVTDLDPTPEELDQLAKEYELQPNPPSLTAEEKMAAVASLRTELEKAEAARVKANK